MFEPLRAEEYDAPTTEAYLGAFAMLASGELGALAAFAAAVGRHPENQLASFHLKRLLNGAAGTRIDPG